jgi:hypothetical protein
VKRGQELKLSSAFILDQGRRKFDKLRTYSPESSPRISGEGGNVKIGRPVVNVSAFRLHNQHSIPSIIYYVSTKNLWMFNNHIVYKFSSIYYNTIQFSIR